MFTKNQLGFLYMFLSVCAFSVMDLIVKWSDQFKSGLYCLLCLPTCEDWGADYFTQLSGLYKSGPMYCTQCEAMGFRRWVRKWICIWICILKTTLMKVSHLSIYYFTAFTKLQLKLVLHRKCISRKVENVENQTRMDGGAQQSL